MTGCYFLALALAAGGAVQERPLAVKIERDVAVPMRDGVVSRADVYRPDRGGPYPAILERTPFSKAGREFNRFVKAGYIVVCQDARGRYKSDGVDESFLRPETHDAEDGYDTIEWAGRLSGSTGKVGTFGTLYHAFLQWWLAPLRLPSLVAMSAISIPARYTDLEWPGTIWPGRRLKWWIASMSPDMRRRAGRPGTHTPAEANVLWDAGEGGSWLWSLPWLEVSDQAFEHEAAAVRHWLRNPHLDPWKLHEGCPEISVPNLDFVGWYDHCNGDMLLFRSMVKHGKTEATRKGQRIVIGPWSHAGRAQRGYGSIDFGSAAAIQIRWFDHWRKGKPNGVDADAPVRIFVMGVNRWRYEDEWPLSRAHEREVFLTSGGAANTPDGDGELLPHTPSRTGSDRYTYDARHPVLFLYGAAMFTIPTDQRPLAACHDILVYQSEPLTEAVEVTGNPLVELYATSSAPDTDFFVRLVDVAPDGLAQDLSMGMVQARYHKSLTEPELLAPGEVTNFTIRMSPTSIRFQPGHRIRLDVTSSDFPNYDRNHNTAAGGNADAALQAADQTIYHGGSRASKLVLPVIPN